jgi:hypothetical protein
MNQFDETTRMRIFSIFVVLFHCSLLMEQRKRKFSLLLLYFSRYLTRKNNENKNILQYRCFYPAFNKVLIDGKGTEKCVEKGYGDISLIL